LNKTATSLADLDLGTAYREWAPQPALADRLVCIWQDPARRRVQPVLPDACIDLVWDGAVLFVAGPDTHAAPVDDAASYVGVRFRPTAAPGLLGISSDELVDARVDLADLWGHAARELSRQLEDRPDRALPSIERALRQRLETAAEPDHVVAALVRELAAPGRRALGARADDRYADLGLGALADEDSADEDVPGLRLEAASASLGVSPRTLRRRCTTALGYGPKTLERILRFRRALRLLRQHKPLAEAARLAGYADQAHLTNEAQRLAGTTPAVLAATPNLAISTNGCD
jgi:AraC-like DNA-binding protein